MKDAIKSGDWAGVSSLVAEKVNGAFAYINWDGIQKKLNGFVDKLTDGLNSFIKGVDWTGLGAFGGGGVCLGFQVQHTGLNVPGRAVHLAVIPQRIYRERPGCAHG
mgnify:CR=1 FL=1